MEHVRSAYGVVADQYVELFADTAATHADDLALITRHLSIRPGAVLDVGCGPGHLTAFLCAQGVDAAGLDLVPEFLDHARASNPGGRYELGSMDDLPVPDGALAGALAWYSLIHVPPDDLDRVLVELRRAMAAGATLVTGFFDGEEVAAFDHQVVTAYAWPVDEFAERLARAGFSEVDRERRSGVAEPGRRSHAAVVAIAR